MNTFNEYVSEVVNALKNTLGEDYDVTINVINKNGQNRTRICIKEAGANIAPCIDIDKMYEKDEKGEYIDSAVGEILSIYEQNKAPNVDISFFSDYEKVKENLFPILYSEDRVDESIISRNIPGTDLYLSAAVKIAVNEEAGHVKVKKAHVLGWDVSEDEVIDKAMENLSKQTPIVKHMFAFLNDIAPVPGMYEEPLPSFFAAPPMYIATSNSKSNGAAVIFLPEVQEEIEEKVGEDFIVLPSSKHEVICIPGNSMETDNLIAMVKEINSTEVDPEDVLSDNVYQFNSDTREYKVIA